MAVFTDIERLPAFRNAVITIGTFDGVHQGHKAILAQVTDRAAQAGGESVLITFEPHPRKVLFPDQPVKLLTTLHQKQALITAAGIQHIVLVPFTIAFSQLSALEYIQQFLVRVFHPAAIVIGYDHHFGHDRAGDIALLKQYETTCGYSVYELPAQLIELAAVSSTKIRKALNAGHVHEAAKMLGRNYSITGKVIQGKQLGRTLGYPTANLELDEPDQLVPANGIYAITAIWEGKQYNGMASIGYNPTVTNEKKLHIEANLFDFEEQIYGDQLEIAFVAWLRSEEKFASLDALKEQIAKDKTDSLSMLT
jgi:riboflavin kinase/FMN adenylyltransferase